jgi:hypothetical protein
MKSTSAVVALLFAGLVTLSSAHADVLVAEFNIMEGTPSASGGQVTFTLNGDGTIAGSVSQRQDPLPHWGLIPLLSLASGFRLAVMATPLP